MAPNGPIHNASLDYCTKVSCFLANAFRLLLYGAAYNLVNLFRQQLLQPWHSAQIETLLRAQLVQIAPRIHQLEWTNFGAGPRH